MEDHSGRQSKTKSSCEERAARVAILRLASWVEQRVHGRAARIAGFVAGLTLAALAARAANVEIAGNRVTGHLRPLHGGNGGPLAAGGLVDLSAAFRELRIPCTRLHDCHWPNPDVVDIHAIFPDFHADPDKPESYAFTRTDEYVQAIVDAGCQPIYRLGESIEHTRTKYHVHPPADPEKWARICLGIIRHYNEGWASGFHHRIRYWEIWNEPENRPNMWTGSDEDYLLLYETTAKTIKRSFPALQVGGPSLGDTGRIADGRLEPSAFMITFLQRCRDRQLPLDFFSWHLYTDDPSECLLRAKAIRELLNQHGFERTELHFNEWNYLPGKDWSALSIAGQGAARERFYQQMGGAPGAAFAASVLINLQDSPVDVANFYSLDNQGFGVFTTEGSPKRAFYAIKAFSLLQDTPERLSTRGGDPRTLSIWAGINKEKSRIQVLISSMTPAKDSITLSLKNHPWPSAIHCAVRAVSAVHELTPAQTGEWDPGAARMTLPIDGPTVLLIEWTGVP